MAVAVMWIAGLVIAPLGVVEVGRLGAVAALAALAVGLAAVPLAAGAQSLRARRAWTVALTTAAALAGLAAGAPRPSLVAVPQGLCRVEGLVEDTRHGRGADAWSTVRVLRGVRIADGVALPEGVSLRVRSALPRGARVQALLRVSPRVAYRNPTPHPPWPAVAAPDAHARLARGAAVKVLRRHPPWDALEAARAETRRSLGTTLSPRAAGMARALVLGDSAAVAREDREAVRGAGLAHVLAVSGLHVSLVAGLVVLCIRRALLMVRPFAARRDPTRVAAALGIPLALAHAAFAGGAPSAWRAAITVVIAWALVVLGRRPRALQVAATAALVLGAAAPGDASRPGFLLSILATAAVVTTSMPEERSARAWIGAAFSISWRTTVATAPVVLWCFGDVPIVGVVANLFLVPIGTALVVPLAVLHAVAAALLPPIAPVTGQLFEIVAAGFVAACDVFATAPPDVALPPPTLWQGLVLALGCGAVLFARRRAVQLAAVALTVLALIGAEAGVRRAEKPTGVLRVTFLDVGQGDAALIDLPDGQLLAVDAGGAHAARDDPGRRVLVPLLAARRRDRVDVAVLTHPHPDHYGGLPAVLSALPVREIWDSGQGSAEAPQGPVAELLSRGRDAGALVRSPEGLCGRPRRFGPVRIDVVAPCPRYDPGRDPNDNSLVLRIGMGRRAILMTGDAEEHEERLLAASRRELSADVLKIAHHGSRTSTTPELLAAVDPAAAIISAGRGNRYGHPHPEVLARLKSRGVRVVRIDQSGGTTVTTDGDWMRIETWRGEHWSLGTRSPAPSH